MKKVSLKESIVFRAVWTAAVGAVLGLTVAKFI